MVRLQAWLIGYLFGNLLFAQIIGHFLLHANPMDYGSGNPGSANVGHVFGRKWGIITCVGDLAKTTLALLLVHFLFPGDLCLAYAGFGVMAGHCFPFWNHFQGGKGVAVAALFTVAFDWWAGLFTLLLAWLLTVLMKNLTIPPLVFMLVFSVYEVTQHKEAGLIFFVMTGIMTFRFGRDLIDFFKGKSKKVDILTGIKKKLGPKV